MGRDNQPKHRQQARSLKRRAATRAPYERLLIVCEGEKTEPLYIHEIRDAYRLSSTNVQVAPSGFGTEPIQVVEYAEHLFRDGDATRAIAPKAFDHVLAVFDRDDHHTYHPALSKARALNQKLRNDENSAIPFQAIASVPCFELWLLLHFEDVNSPVHRDHVFERLRRYLPGYTKGQGGNWAATREFLATATRRATVRANATSAYDGHEPYTALHELVSKLVHLKDPTMTTV